MRGPGSDRVAIILTSDRQAGTGRVRISSLEKWHMCSNGAIILFLYGRGVSYGKQVTALRFGPFDCDCKTSFDTIAATPTINPFTSWPMVGRSGQAQGTTPRQLSASSRTASYPRERCMGGTREH